MPDLHPKISLVICTYNREKFLGNALHSLTQQTLPPEQFEIIIVNNNATDRTEEISLHFIQANPKLNIHYFVERNQGLSYARNRGIQEAHSDIITFIDDDAEAQNDFLEQILNFLEQRPDAAGIGGKIVPKYEGIPPKWMNHYLHGFVTKVDLGSQIKAYRGKNYPAGCNMTYRRQLLQSVGGFNEKLKWRADDKYIYYAIKPLAKPIYYLPHAIVLHNIDDYRTTDENFVQLSKKFGSEESIRMKGLGAWPSFKKKLEFVFKLAASLLIGLGFALKGEWIKGKYTIRYRYFALIGLLSKNQ